MDVYFTEHILFHQRLGMLPSKRLHSSIIAHNKTVPTVVYMQKGWKTMSNMTDLVAMS